MIKNILLVGTGSFLGGVLRYTVSVLMHSETSGFPWATFTANMCGSLLIGLLWGWSIRFPGVPIEWNLFLGVGVCGGFTTFSTFTKESLAMLQTGNHAAFIPYALGSIVLGILSVSMGYMMTK